jgi:hypothetical protein
LSATDTSPVRAFIEGLPGPAADAPAFGPPREGADPLVHELIVSMLLWNASAAQASSALARLQPSCVDENELRVCFPADLVELMGPRYPHAEERGTRLGLLLHAVFEREHAMTLESLTEMSKRDARAYLDEMPGMVPFVAARVFLVGLGGHAFPMDERLLAPLIDAGAFDDDADVATASARLERAFRAGEALPAYLALEAYVESMSAAGPKSKRSKAPRSSRSKRASSTS